MTPEDLDATLRALEDHAPHDIVNLVRARIAALEKERDAALADNAALVLMLTQHLGATASPSTPRPTPAPRCWRNWDLYAHRWLR